MQQPDVIGPRIVAALVDIVLVLVLYVTIAVLSGDIRTEHTTVAGAEHTNTSVSLAGLPAVLFAVLAFAYYWLSEATWGQTLGKRLAHVRVVRADGGRAGAGAAFVRNLLRPIDALPILYLVGFLVAMSTGSRRQRIGDLAAGTRVRSARE